MTTAAPQRFGFLGAGQMATALARGWAAAGLLDPTTASAADPYPAARQKFAAATGITVYDLNPAVVETADVLVLAVKPQTVPAVLPVIRPYLRPHHVLISIAAGVTLKQLADGLGDAVRTVRVMPNTPCLVNSAATAYAAGPAAAAGDLELTAKLFESVGRAVPVAENLLDAVTGLSGSGPAFVYLFIEALADGGVRAGLPRDVAMLLAAQTVKGAARMVLETGTHPGALKDAVASPGGTTIAGLHALEKAAFRAAAMDAVAAAAARSTELGKR